MIVELDFGDTGRAFVSAQGVLSEEGLVPDFADQPNPLDFLGGGEFNLTYQGELPTSYAFLTALPGGESVAEVTTLPGSGLLVVPVLVRSDTTEGLQVPTTDLLAADESFVSIMQTTPTKVQQSPANQDGAAPEDAQGMSPESWAMPEVTGPPAYQLGVQEKMRSLPGKPRRSSQSGRPPGQGAACWRRGEPSRQPRRSRTRSALPGRAGHRRAASSAREGARLGRRPRVGAEDLFTRPDLLPRTIEEARHAALPAPGQPWTPMGTALLAVWLLRPAEVGRRDRRTVRQ